ncbi:hypothetical protein HK103_002699 [Boothiomyces macroporosus]|uniref:Uncharacterized protein n=1 Tax=Boothiomyces macroporosus TaxID=261099 RepID=A0AAD5UNR3_9FUNG|nr:hypothetical protein HK103_002699 [Boothiomyces macroporosus]
MFEELKTLQEYLEKDIHSIKQESENGTLLNAEEISNISKMIHHEITTYALARKETSSEKALKQATDSILLHINLLVTHASGTANSIGKALKLHLLESALNLVNSLQAFENEGDIDIMTGEVWEKCLVFQQLPSSNSLYVFDLLSQVIELLDDAAAEANDIIDGELPELDGLSLEESKPTDKDKEFIKNSQVLVKTSILVLKKAKAVLKSKDEEYILRADNILDLANKFSEKADDLISSLYLPIDYEDELIFESINGLESHCIELLDILSQENSEWVQMCRAQLGKVKSKLEK